MDSRAVTILEPIGGISALSALADAWHRRCLADDVVAHAFNHPDQRPDHLARLTAYWVEQLGGPPNYTTTYGDHTSVLRLHAGNGEHADMDRRGVRCMAQALEDVGIADPQLRADVLDWWTQMVGEMAAYPRSPEDVPTGLAISVWRA